MPACHRRGIFRGLGQVGGHVPGSTQRVRSAVEASEHLGQAAPVICCSQGARVALALKSRDCQGNHRGPEIMIAQIRLVILAEITYSSRTVFPGTCYGVSGRLTHNEHDRDHHPAEYSGGDRAAPRPCAAETLTANIPAALPVRLVHSRPRAVTGALVPSCAGIRRSALIS